MKLRIAPVCAIVSALAARRVDTLADLLRVFNYQPGVRVACKAFHNRLARPGFEAFMQAGSVAGRMAPSMTFPHREGILGPKTGALL